MALIDKLNAIGDAIREKNGTTDLIPLSDMPQAILNIVSGGITPQLTAEAISTFTMTTSAEVEENA